MASRLLRPAGIEVHHAALLGQANSLLTTANATVPLTDTVFLDGTWEDANKVLAGGELRRILVSANAHVQCGGPIQYCRAAGRS